MKTSVRSHASFFIVLYIYYMTIDDFQDCKQMQAIRKAEENPQFDPMSKSSKKILKTYGNEAPRLLRDYADLLEDTIMKLHGNLKAMRQEFSLTYDADPEVSEDEEQSDT